MRRFICEVFGVLAAAMVLFCVVNICVVPGHPVDDSVPKDIAIANTGSSHGQHAFDYSVMNDTVAHNFALSSQSIWYDASLIDYYVDNMTEGSLLFIPISYFTLWYDELSDAQFATKNRRYYSILDMDHIRFIDAVDECVHRLFQVAFLADDWEKTLVKKQALDEENDVQDDLEVVGKKRAKYHKEKRNIYDAEGNLMPIRVDNLESLNDLIERCKASGITPVLITTPFLDYYTRWFDDEFEASFYGAIADTCSQYDVEYWDYSHDAAFSMNPDLFQDTDHLNELGGKRFTELIHARAIAEGLIDG